MWVSKNKTSAEKLLKVQTEGLKYWNQKTLLTSSSSSQFPERGGHWCELCFIKHSDFVFLRLLFLGGEAGGYPQTGIRLCRAGVLLQWLTSCPLRPRHPHPTSDPASPHHPLSLQAAWLIHRQSVFRMSSSNGALWRCLRLFVAWQTK